MNRSCLVIVSDAGESWSLEGDEYHKHDVLDDSKTNALLPRLLSKGWQIQSINAGSGAKDDSSYWLVHLTKF